MNKNYDDESISIAVDFVCEVIRRAIKEFNIDFNTVDKILDKSGYWELFNRIDIVCVGAHDGVEPVLQRLRSYL